MSAFPSCVPDADEAVAPAAPIRRSFWCCPGSRSSEIRRLLSIFGDALARVSARIGPMELVLPTLPHLAAQVRAGVAGWAVTPRIVVEPADKWAAFRSARAALAASGTVTLELALAGVPTVAAYRGHACRGGRSRGSRACSNAFSSVILANLVLGENVVPEFLQRDCTPQRLADALMPLLSDTPERLRQIDAFARLDRHYGIGRGAERQGGVDRPRYRPARPPRPPQPTARLKVNGLLPAARYQCPNHPAIGKRMRDRRPYAVTGA